MGNAWGFIETRGLAASLEVTDRMLKCAPVMIKMKTSGDSALTTIIIEGETAAVQMAITEGIKQAKMKENIVAYTVMHRPVLDETGLLK